MITYQIGGPSPFPIIKDFRTDPRTAWVPTPIVEREPPRADEPRRVAA